ncbi:MAG: DUF2164 domain-containing protein [Gammaproteobacteria bacterium]|nr:DUF2164 domain-containing protein [Gammaproteobacteria bacterium]
MADFTREEKEAIVAKIQAWFEKELNQDIGQFDAEFLLDFFGEEVGKYFYNRGLNDAQAILEGRMDNITEAISELEKVVD